MFNTLVAKAKENKNMLIKVGSALAGAVAGALVAAAFVSSEDQWEEDPGLPEESEVSAAE